MRESDLLAKDVTGSSVGAEKEKSCDVSDEETLPRISSNELPHTFPLSVSMQTGPVSSGFGSSVSVGVGGTSVSVGGTSMSVDVETGSISVDVETGSDSVSVDVETGSDSVDVGSGDSISVVVETVSESVEESCSDDGFVVSLPISVFTYCPITKRDGVLSATANSALTLFSPSTMAYVSPL